MSCKVVVLFVCLFVCLFKLGFDELFLLLGFKSGGGY